MSFVLWFLPINFLVIYRSLPLLNFLCLVFFAFLWNDENALWIRFTEQANIESKLGLNLSNIPYAVPEIRHTECDPLQSRLIIIWSLIRMWRVWVRFPGKKKSPGLDVCCLTRLIDSGRNRSNSKGLTLNLLQHKQTKKKQATKKWIKSRKTPAREANERRNHRSLPSSIDIQFSTLESFAEPTHKDQF